MLTKTQQNWVKQLNRRLNHLEGRIAATPQIDRSYDRAEVNAIKFSLYCIEKADAAGIIQFHTGFDVEPESRGD